ncbi:MAG: hypothetical protein DLM60_23195 [Pseudonocardiales bacterium]|nr:MAG: hypothetical protein DLM60_23195 [Pseudonocardiales bacterium]
MPAVTVSDVLSLTRIPPVDPATAVERTATVSPGATLELPWQTGFNALAYVLAGRGNVGAEHWLIHDGQLAVFGPGDTVRIAAAVTLWV